MTIDSLPEDAGKFDCGPGPPATMACPASACASSIILSTDPPLSFPGAPRSFLFPVCFFCFYLLGAQVQVCSLSFFFHSHPQICTDFSSEFHWRRKRQGLSSPSDWTGSV